MIKKYLKGLDSEEYKKVLPKINETNRKNIIFVCSVIIFLISILLCILPITNLLNFAYPLYLGFECATVLILLECIFIKPKSSPLIIPLTIALILDVLTFGACLSFFNETTKSSTVFFVMLFAMPFVFTLHPFYTSIITAIVTLCFLCVEYKLKTPEVFRTDLINGICYSILSMIFGTYMSIMRYRRHCLEEENKSFTDLKLQESQIEMHKQMEILRSLSGIYNSVHLIDLEENTVVEYVTNINLRKYVNSSVNAAAQMRNSMNSLMKEEYKQIAFEFTDLTTLQKRMEGKKIITMDMIGIFTGWLRASFITNETNIFDQPTQVLFTTQIIDEEKRREETLFKQSNTDSLTGLFNRSAFEEDLNQYKESIIPDNFTIIVFDVNGLKNINNTKSHAAGDELLLGAASCIKASFGRYGKLYRSGGDEFIAMFSAYKTEIKELISEFEQSTTKWIGYQVPNLSISLGYACHKDYKNSSIMELKEIADRKMYESKAKFYENASSKKS